MDNVLEWDCAGCPGTVVKTPGQRRRPKYCSPSCKSRAQGRRSRAALYADPERHARVKAAAAAQARERTAQQAAARPKSPCPYCQVPVPHHRGNPRNSCDAPDCVRAYENKRHREWQREYRERTGTWHGYTMPSRPQRKSNTHCVDCGAPVKWGTTQETRCRKCGQRRNAQRRYAAQRLERLAAEAERLAEYNSCRARALRKLEVAAQGVPSNPRWPFAAGHCQRCGQYFVCRMTKVVPRFCTTQCARLDHKAVRRAKQAGVKLTPARRWKVYERDSWVCQLCMRPINRVVPAPHPMSASIDHIIPLDAGGDHSEDIWQTAHFICNSIKSNQILEEATA